MSSKVVDLTELKVAMVVCKELPRLRHILLETKDKIEQYMHYTDAKNVLNAIEESLIMIDLHCASYQSVIDQRGK